MSSSGFSSVGITTTSADLKMKAHFLFSASISISRLAVDFEDFFSAFGVGDFLATTSCAIVFTETFLSPVGLSLQHKRKSPRLVIGAFLCLEFGERKKDHKGIIHPLCSIRAGFDEIL